MLAQWTAGSSVLCPPCSDTLMCVPPLPRHQLILLGASQESANHARGNTSVCCLLLSFTVTNPVKLSLLVSRYLGKDGLLCLSEFVK